MRGCLQALAVLTAILFVFSAVFALLIVNLLQVVTAREAVKATLDGMGATIIEAGPAVVVEALQEQARLYGLPQVNVDEAVLQQAIGGLIPPDWVDAQAETTVDAVFDALESGDPAAAQVELNVTPLVERMRGAPGRQAIGAVVESLPICPGVWPEFDVGPGNVAIPRCLPPGTNTAELTQQIHTAVIETIDLNPQLIEEAGSVRLPLLPPEQDAPAQWERLQRLHWWFTLSQRWGWLLWLLPLWCLLLILFFTVRSVSDFGHWWGWPLLAAAILAFVLSAVAPALLLALVRTAVTPPETGVIGLSLSRFLLQVFEPLSNLWLRRVFIQAGFMFVLGLILVVVGFWTRPREAFHYNDEYTARL